MKKTRKIFKHIDITEYKNFEKYLEKKARNGWMLIELNNNTMVFELGDKRSLTFNVSLLDQYAPFDFPDGEMEKDYRTLCEEAGWIFCASNTYFQVFYSESNSEIIPVHTDASEEYRIIKKAILKSNLVNLFLICLYLAIGNMNFRSFSYEVLLSNSSIFSMIWPYAIIVIWLVMLTHPVIWLIKNKFNIHRDNELTFFSKKQIFIKNIILWGLMILYTLMGVSAFADLPLSPVLLLIVVLSIALPAAIAIFCIKRFRSIKRTRKENITFLIVASALAMIVTLGSTTLIMASDIMRTSSDDAVDKAPIELSLLKLSDFGTMDEPERSHLREQSSAFSPLNVIYYESLGRKAKDSEVSSVRTTYIELNNKDIADFIFDMFMDEEYKRRDKMLEICLENGLEEDAQRERNRIAEIDTDLWNADRGYYLSENKSDIVIQKENLIYILSSPVDFSDREIVEICRIKLDL